ncbi:MAG: hypothetical protein L0H93_14125 [Nocardioides sp.]|nr:hypothetical protein [Nocardioides sp.]
MVNDAYNANPASMDAAISVATAISTRRGSRSIAILGEMKELGESSEVAHVGVGEAAARAGVDVLIAVGEAAAVMLEGAAHVTDWLGTAVSVRDRDSALAWLHANQLAGDVVLVKASRAAELEWVAQNLIDPKNLTDPEEQRE